MSNNPCSHDLAKCHATEQRYYSADRASLKQITGFAAFSRNVSQPPAKVRKQLASWSAWYSQVLQGNGNKHISAIQTRVFHFFTGCSEFVAAAPASRAAAEMYELANGQMTVTSQQNALPFCQRTRESPVPSERDKYVGPLSTETPAAE